MKYLSNFLGTALLGLTLGAGLAQVADKPAPDKPSVPELSFSEQAGVDKVRIEFSTAYADFAKVQEEVAKAHPGYQLGGDGKLQKTPPAPKPTEPAKESKPAPAPTPAPAKK